MDETKMYATQTCNVRSGPSTEYDVVAQLTTNQEVTVIGKVKADNGKAWCVLKTEDDTIQMVSGSLLSTERITTKPSSGLSSSGSGSGSSSSGSTITQQPATPSDCSGDCDEGYCSADCFDNWTPSDCDFGDCSASYCAQAE